jgi:predicted glycoside hydrolase/deacetylase ChbG (UPF0249 family)
MVNEGIVVASRRGIVRNTALLVNLPDVAASVACLRDAGDLDLGIHLNLTSGPPVSKADQVPSLLGKGGTFPGLSGFLARAALGRIRWGEVRRECEAQIELGFRLGCRFTSVSSHQHVHMLSRFVGLAGMLARSYGIPVVRLSRYHTAGGVGPRRLKAWALFPCALGARGILRRQGVLHNDYLLGILPVRTERALAGLCAAVQRLPGGLCELVCHPGYVDSTLEQRDGYAAGRVAELEILTAPPLRSALRTNGIELTTYRDLAADRRVGEG